MSAIKGFKYCKRINVKIGEKTEELVVTKHFEDKISMSEMGISLKKGGIEKAIHDSVVITDRPRNINILLKNDVRLALYLYNHRANAIMVLEEDTVSREYRILKTAYVAHKSDWVAQWLSSTHKWDRVSFGEYFKDKSLSLSDH